jgi:hypothetical protein
MHFFPFRATAVFRLAPGWMVLEDPLLIATGSVLLALFARWLDRRRSARRVVVTAQARIYAPAKLLAAVAAQTAICCNTRGGYSNRTFQ